MFDADVPSDLLAPCDTFAHRHIGPDDAEIRRMLKLIGVGSLDELVNQTVPVGIRLKSPLALDAPRSESQALTELRAIASKNQVFRSLIGMGYYDTITPPVILRNIMENPGWYTQYTPYQAEISQGRLEALINFQTMVADLTALPLANASLLDEATAAAEAMHMCVAAHEDDVAAAFFVAQDCHPQTIAVVQTRAKPLGIEIVVGDPKKLAFNDRKFVGVLLQYPTTDGRIECYKELTEKAHAAGALVVVATDLLALTLIKPPGEWGADIAVGNAQRLGVPLGAGGPHAAFMACRDEFKRQMPGRIIGVSKDVHGKPAYRLAIQTREQHIRREKATSNICTAQVLLAVMAGMYAVYHGPEGLRRIAQRVHLMTQTLRRGLLKLGHRIAEDAVFDTLRVEPVGRTAEQVLDAARARRINLRPLDGGALGLSLDETCDRDTLRDVLACFGGGNEDIATLGASAKTGFPPAFARETAFLMHPVFSSYHCEHEMLRYMNRLQSRDLSLTTSNIPLGSCTMKLNATAEMIPVTWPEFGRIHPFAPAGQQQGYAEMYRQLEAWLAEITGFAAVSLQPNAGSQGEYAGLLAIRAYREAKSEVRSQKSEVKTQTRDVCLIPTSAHGTNPASAVMAGFRVVAVRCDEKGNIDVADLRSKAAEHAARLGALMVTYPSTHGVFEESIREICDIVHQHGGQVYMDGANMNAQVGLTRPADIGADVCHLNLHKTFCIPHGGGGPGMGPIAVAAHLKDFLPGHVARPPSVGSDVARPPSAASVDLDRPGAAGLHPAGLHAAGLHPAARPVAQRAADAHRRFLPHIRGDGRPLFVTFCTQDRWTLPESVRGAVLNHCLHDHGTMIQVYVAVVMPDHIHLVFSPLEDESGVPFGLPQIMNSIKGSAAHTVNKLLNRKGVVWQPEYFDHVLRKDESLEAKVEYVCQNPVRRGLVSDPDQYPWIWREWINEAVARPPSAGSDAARPSSVGAPETQNSRPGAAGLRDRPGAAGLQVGPVSAAPYGSPSILPISWMYIRMMGGEGLTKATQVAILNANYMATRLEKHYPVLYEGSRGRVAHEFIIDCRQFEESAGVKVEDIAKRMMDYGFHAPTMSFPVPGTLMIEPTESESRAELDRLCDTLIGIREEIREIEQGRADRTDNALKHAPHTAMAIASAEWSHPYSREQAAYPAAWTRDYKYWPPVGRVDNVWGDRHLFCTCVPIE